MTPLHPSLTPLHVTPHLALKLRQGVNTRRHRDDDAAYGLLAAGLSNATAKFFFDDLGLKIDFEHRALFYAAAVVSHHQECEPAFVNVGLYVQRRLVCNVLKSVERVGSD